MQLRYVDVSVDLCGYDANNNPTRKRIQTEQILRAEFTSGGSREGFATLLWEGCKFPNVNRKSFIHEPDTGHALPESLPVEWLASVKQPSSQGTFESWIVLREGEKGSYDKFRIHLAYWEDTSGRWNYAHGDYIMEGTFQEAFKKFLARVNK